MDFLKAYKLLTAIQSQLEVIKDETKWAEDNDVQDLHSRAKDALVKLSELGLEIGLKLG